jgi:hypothetical protein
MMSDGRECFNIETVYIYTGSPTCATLSATKYAIGMNLGGFLDYEGAACLFSGGRALFLLSEALCLDRERERCYSAEVNE